MITLEGLFSDMSSLDEDTVDYLQQVLDDEDVWDDVDTLVETLTGFCPEIDEDDLRKKIIAIKKDKEPDKDVKPASPAAPLPLSPPVATEDENQDSESDHSSDKSTEAANHKAKKQSKSQERRRKREERKRSKKEKQSAELVEDEASAWKDCQDAGEIWGGRGRGGRGEYAGATNNVRSNIHLRVSVALANGTVLLGDTHMDIQKGHRYGLVGRNGVGKSTLLHRLAAHAIPGMPSDLRVFHVQQQQPVDGSKASVLQTLLAADSGREELLQEQERLEALLESGTAEEVVDAAERLGELAIDLDEAESSDDRALSILKGLQFTGAMINGSVQTLSGGWRMRLALAKALFVPCDLLLLDECTNHLDLYGLQWLMGHLQQIEDKCMVIVSHDTAFLDAVCTDIVVLAHQQLTYHVGNYSDYMRQEQEKAAREMQILDAADRQRAKAMAFILKQQANTKSTDPNKQRQAKMIKDKKLERMGNYREDGKRYQLFSLKKLDMSSNRLAQKVNIQADDAVVHMRFPDPTWPNGIAEADALLRLEDFSFRYKGSDRQLLSSVTLSLTRGSKVAMVGRNGCGKTSLFQLLLNQIEGDRSGTMWIHPNIRIGHMSQYSVEELDSYKHMTVVEYAEKILSDKKASSRMTSKASGNIRQYLGAFGLGGSKLALGKIGTLSGGERMRLCFATVLADEPHLLLLDESTNHVDIETLESLSAALQAYAGTVLMISHNQGFLSGFCQELWALEKGQIFVSHNDTETFDELFAEYRSFMMKQGSSLRTQRQEKAQRAKRAAKQRAGATQTVALI